MCKIVQCNIYFAACALVLAGCAIAAQAKDPAAGNRVPWHAVDATTGRIDDRAGLEELAEAFPNSSSVRLRLLEACIVKEDFAQALAMAEDLAREGYAFSPAAIEYLQGLVPHGESAEWLANNRANAATVSASEIATTIPAEARLPEGLSVVADGVFAVSTVVSREVWFGTGDDWISWAFPGAGNLSGILSDASGIVVASGNLGMIPAEEVAFSGLIGVEEANQPTIMEAPAGVQLSDIAFFRDQTIYASDPLGGGVYRSGTIGAPLEVLVNPGILRSPQGIAPSEDGEHLYISDYRYGLAVIDTRTGVVSRLVAGAPMLLDGIDGLWLHNGELIAIQNGFDPKRIVALTLSDDGNRITSLRVLEQAHPDWTEPLGGDIHDGALYYIGNGSWDLFNEGGTLKEGADLRPTHIRRLDLFQKPTE